MNQEPADTQTNDVSAYPPRYKHLKRWLIVLGLGVLLFVLAHWQWGRVMHHRLESLVQAIEAKGQPIRFGDMVIDAVADVDNAVYYYNQARVNWPRLAGGQLITDTDWHADPEQHEDPITDNAAYLEQCQAVIELLRKASQAPGYDWDITLTSPVFMQLIPHLGNTRRLARLISDAATRAHDQGDDRLSVELTARLFDLADATHQPPQSVISHLVAISIRAMASSIIEENLPDWSLATAQVTTPPERKQLEALIERLTDNTLRDDFVECWIGERWAMYDTAQAILNGQMSWYNANPVSWWEHVELWIMRPVCINDTHMFVQILTRYVEASYKAKTLAEFHDLANVEAMLEHIEEYYMLYPISSITLRSDDSIARTHFRHLTKSRLAATALAIKLYVYDHGQRPETLEQLVPQYLATVPLDPMANDGSTIRYLPEGVVPAIAPDAHFTAEEKEKLPNQRLAIIYSVGANGRDDGGLFYFGDDGTIDACNGCGNEYPSDHHFLLDPSPKPVIVP